MSTEWPEDARAVLAVGINIFFVYAEGEPSEVTHPRFPSLFARVLLAVPRRLPALYLVLHGARPRTASHNESVRDAILATSSHSQAIFRDLAPGALPFDALQTGWHARILVTRHLYRLAGVGIYRSLRQADVQRHVGRQFGILFGADRPGGREADQQYLRDVVLSRVVPELTTLLAGCVINARPADTDARRRQLMESRHVSIPMYLAFDRESMFEQLAAALRTLRESYDARPDLHDDEARIHAFREEHLRPVFVAMFAACRGV